MLFLFGACSSLPPFTNPSLTFTQIQYNGEILSIRTENGLITNIHDNQPDQVLDYTGYWIAPAFIDSHVHLAYLPASESLLNGGVAAAVDLAAPISFLSTNLAPLQIIQTGPMITSIQGYPTQGWGSNGYGTQCADVSCIESSIQHQYSLGARAVKLPLTNSPTLQDSQILRAVETAMSLGVPTIAHALTNTQAERAAQLGIDVLAHTPTAPSSDTMLEAWSKKHVISTLQAFGSIQAINNLALLHEQGASILYGTDLGNTQQAKISLQELDLLSQAGLSNEDIIIAGTTAPADFWGFTDLGQIDVGYRASFLILDADPNQDISTLSRPVEVWIEGQKR